MFFGWPFLEGLGSVLMIPPIYIFITMNFNDLKVRAAMFGAMKPSQNSLFKADTSERLIAGNERGCRPSEVKDLRFAPIHSSADAAEWTSP
jgi:hypothetical protein